MNAPRPLVIVGAGGFGREVVELVRDINAAGERFELLGVVADGTPDLDLLGVSRVVHLGAIEDLAGVAASAAYVVAVGDAVGRERLAARSDAACHEAVTLLHTTAVVGRDIRLSPGAIVAAHCSITTNVAVGRHVHVDRACTVGHDAVLEDFVRLNPGAVVSGNVTMRRGSTLGTGAVTRQGVEIGAGTYVGAGAAVVSDLPPGVVAMGVPARATRDVGDRG